MKQLMQKISTSDWIASIAALSALVSIFVSVRSCQQVEKQNFLAQTQFAESRSLVWICSLDNDLNLEISPSNYDIAVETAEIVFPRALSGGDYEPLHPPHFRMSLKNIYRRLWDSCSIAVRHVGESGGYLPTEIPFIIKAHYIVGDDVRFDKSLYRLSFFGELEVNATPQDKVKLQVLTLKGGHFDRRLTTEDTDSLLNQLWPTGAQGEPIGGTIYKVE